MTEQEKQPEKKHFYLSIVGTQIISDGNMNVNEVAAALIDLAYGKGVNDGQKKED